MAEGGASAVKEPVPGTYLANVDDIKMQGAVQSNVCP